MLLAQHETAKYRDASELYEDLEEGFIPSADDEVKRKFLYYCLQADEYDLRAFMQRNAGLYLNDMIIPSTDAEEEYLEYRGSAFVKNKFIYNPCCQGVLGACLRMSNTKH